MSFINDNHYFKDSISAQLKGMGYRELTKDDGSNKIYYCDVNYNDRKNPTFNKCEIVNQLENVNPLGNKKDQYELHMKYYKKRPEYLPFTMSFSRENLDDISSLFINNPKDGPLVYIVKPENDSFRNGVGLVKSKMELIAHLDEFDMYDDWIIQDYIGNPLLLNGKKFHFRIYVIYVQTKDYQVAYLSRVGFIYTANKEFMEDTFDPDIVLSGESTPKNVFYVPEDFQKNFGKSKWDDVVLPQIVKITRETLTSVLDLLKCPRENQKCFKILGYDILIDNDYKCYLAEINARGVTYKYPNQQFLDTFYKNILKLVLPNEPLSNKDLKMKGIPYERILYKRGGEIMENFGNQGDKKLDKVARFNNFYMKLIFPFLGLVLLLLIIQINWKDLFH